MTIGGVSDGRIDSDVSIWNKAKPNPAVAARRRKKMFVLSWVCTAPFDESLDCSRATISWGLSTSEMAFDIAFIWAGQKTMAGKDEDNPILKTRFPRSLTPEWQESKRHFSMAKEF